MAKKLRVLDLFSGLGAFSLGLERVGKFRTVAFCEIDPHARRILADRYPKTKVYHDVRTVTKDRLREDGISGVDVICGGFPCQDASIANIEGKGTNGERTGLFSEIIRLARDLEPRFIVMENVTNLLNRGFGDVLGALAQIGFDAEWDCISARELGFDHERDRIFIVAYPQRAGWERPQQNYRILERAKASFTKPCNAAFRFRSAMVGGERLLRDGYGLTVGMERRRLHALGNAVIPQKVTAIGCAIIEAMEYA